MSINPSRFAINRNGWIIYGIIEAVLFATANLTATSSSHPGTVSNSFFIMFVVGLVLAIMLGAATLIRQRGANR